MIQIKYKDGNTERVRLEVEVSEKAIYRKELMTEEYVLLTFDTAELVNLQKGDYIETEFGRFVIVHLEKPKRNVDGNGGYSYEQKFHAPWERWTTRKLFYSRKRGSEKAWSMTQKPEYFMQIVIDNLLAAGFGEFVAEIDASLTEMKLVQFDGDDIVAGLNKIAEAWETEWWIADDVIHLSKCEYGTPVGFEEGDLIRSMTRSDGQDNDYITRLYAFGSTRNIPTNYRKSEDEETVIEGIVERRLKLPEGTDHIDAWPNLREEDVVEGVAIFDEVYPRRTGKCEDITTEVYRDEVTDDEHPDGELVEWNAYRFKDSGIKFKSDYILPDEELRLTFQSGALAGMDFAVVFNPDGADESSPEAQVWEVVRNDTYGIDLPSDKFHPEEGDEYILYGYDTKMVSDILIPRAEQELLEEAKKFLAKKSVDGSVYTCETDKIRCAGYTERKGELTYNPMYEVDLDVGQSVELRSDNYFSDTEGYRVSRVRAFEKRLDNRFAATYEVGETASYSKSKELNEKMESLTIQNTQVMAMGGGVYLIKRYDGTTPSDHNAYSATRANAEFLHRGQPDVAQGLIKFLAGMEVGYYSKGVEGGKFDDEGNLEANEAVIRTLAQIATAYVQQVGTEKFVDGFAGEGWQIWKAIATGDWNLTIDRLTVRKLMTVYEVLIQKIRAIGGQIIVSAGNGKIKEVQTDEEAGNYTITFEDENTFAVGDLVRCQTWTGANVKHYWVRVSAATADGIVVPISEFEGAVPEPGDECVLMGNTDNPLRQNCVSIAATEDGQPRVDVLNGIKEKNLDECLRARLGNLDGITDDWFPADNQPHGDGLYSDNVYLRGTFLLSTGEDIKTRFEVLEGRLKSEITAVEKQLNDYESYLRNAYFDNDMAGWETDNGVTFFLLGNKWIWTNDKPLANKTAYTGIAEDRNRTVLYIKNRYLIQRNENFESHPDCNETDIEGYKLPKTFYLSFFYRVLTPGRLTVQFENASKEGYKAFDMMSVSEDLEATGEEYKTFEATGLWNGTGDFKLTFSGEIYIYAVRLSLDRIADIEQRYRTLFEQTAHRLTLLAEADKETTRKLEEMEGRIDVMPDNILAEVSSRMTDLENGITEAYKAYLDLKANEINLRVDNLADGLLATGINIQTGEMTFFADKLKFTDTEGKEQMLLENGILNAKAIKASNITADKLEMYQEGDTHPTIRITPEDMGMKVFDEEGDVCQEFTGETVSDIINRFFKDAGSGDVSMDQASGSMQITSNHTIPVSEKWSSGTPTMVKFTQGTIQLSAYVAGFTWSGTMKDPRPIGHSSMAIADLYLCTYEDEACTKRIDRQLITSASCSATNRATAETTIEPGPGVGSGSGTTRPTIPNPNQITTKTYPSKSAGTYIELDGIKKKSNKGGHFKIIMELYVLKSTSNDTARAAWGSSATNTSSKKAPIAATYNSDLYVSNFFANGFCLGTRKDDYVAIFKTTDNEMHFIAENGSAGIRLTENGLEKKIGENKWQAL